MSALKKVERRLVASVREVSFDASSSANLLKMDAGLTIVFFLSPTERVLEDRRLNDWLASCWLLLAEYIFLIFGFCLMKSMIGLGPSCRAPGVHLFSVERKTKEADIFASRRFEAQIKAPLLDRKKVKSPEPSVASSTTIMGSPPDVYRSPFKLVLRGQQQFLDPLRGRSAVWRQKGAIRG